MLRDLIDKILRVTKKKSGFTLREDPYGYAVDGRPAFFLRGWFERIVAKTSIPDDQQKVLEELGQRGTVVYLIKYRSQLDFVFTNLRLFQLGLPAPSFIFDVHPYLWQPRWYAVKLLLHHIYCLLRKGRLPNPYEGGDYRKKILEGKTGLLFILGEKGYYQRTVLVKNDPLDHLLEIQKDCDKPIFIVPIVPLYSRAPSKTRRGVLELFLRHREHPGALHKLLSYIRSYSNSVIEIGEPINLQDVLPELSEQVYERRKQVFELRRDAIESADTIKRAIVGPILKSKLELKDIILHHPKLNAFIQRRARSSNQEVWKVRQEADRNLDEIAADYNYTLIVAGERLLSWILNLLFDGVDVDTESLQKVKKAARNKTLIYVPCHKSHMDYLILSYILFKNNLYPPFIAAGKNLSFWPLGPIFRRGGAFFIRRTFKGNKFYAEIFSLYVKTMVQWGHNIEFFIEGGRSRTGKMVLPKLGLMAILIQAVEEGFCDDLVFVPTSICYDRIPEEEAYVKEISGGAKVDENIKQLVNARRFLKKRYGRVYVQFAEPVSLIKYLHRRRLDLTKMPSKVRHAMYRDFSYKIINSINEASLLTPHGLVAASLLSSSRQGVSMAEFQAVCRMFYDYVAARGIKMSNTLKNYDAVVEDALRDFERSKLVVKLKDEDEDLEEDVFTFDESKRLTLEYYKNNVIHFLLPAVFVSTSILAQQTFRVSLTQMLEDIAFLKDFFKYEFVYNNDLSNEDLVQGVLDVFEAQGWLHPTGDGDQPYLLAHKGLKAADAFHGLIRNYFEGYWLVLRSFQYLQKKPYAEKDLLKKILSLGEKSLKLELIERQESISKIIFGNALKYYVERNVVSKSSDGEKGKDAEVYSGVGDRQLIQHYSKQIGRFMRSPRFTLQVEVEP